MMNSVGTSYVARLGEFLTTDHASRLDPYIKWVRKPVAVLSLATVAAVLCGLYLHPRAFVLAGGLAAILIVGIAWPWVAMRGISGSLAFGRSRIREGESVDAHLRVRGRMPWGAWGLSIRGSLLDSTDATAPGLVYAAGWQVTETCWELVPTRRGEYPGMVPRIASAFPFGLWEASGPLDVPTRLLVWPRTFPVGPIPEAASGREGDGLAPRNKPGTAGDLLGVRPYRRGDSLRRVHWPQSARHGQMIVCEVQAQAMPKVQIVLDVHPDGHVGTGPESSLEWTIRIAASFAEDWIGQRADVEVIFGSTSIVSSRGPVGVRRAQILDALARLQPSEIHGLGDVLCGSFDGGLRIVIATDRAVKELAARSNRDRAERFIILNTSAFDDGIAAIHEALPVRPWIRIDDSTDIPRLVRQGWKEVGVDRRN